MKDLELSLDESAYMSFLLLKELQIRRKRKVKREEVEFLLHVHSLLLIERKNSTDLRKRLEALNGFMGLH